MASDADIQKELDARIYILELELSGLKQRRNALSPIYRLPPEIVAEIFIASIPNVDYRKQKGRTIPHAMALSHVSHSWRAITMRSSEIWGHLHVGVQTKAEVLDFAFERAGNAPLYINLCGFDRKGGPSRPSEGTISALAMIVREASKRCRALDLYVYEESLRSIVDGQILNFDGLQSLKLDLIGTNDQRTEFFQSSFPQLRRLELSGWSRIPLDCSLLQSPHLTHVDIEEALMTGSIMDDLYTIFKRSKCLRKFTIGSFCRTATGDFESQFSQTGSVIPLPSLEILVLPLRHIQLSTTGHVSRFLASLSIPKKSRLEISSGDSEGATHLMAALHCMYGNLEPEELHIGREYVKAWYDSPFDVLGAVRQQPWIALSQMRHDYSIYHIWKWGWSFASLRTLTLDDSSTALPDEDAATFWAYLAGTPTETLTLQVAIPYMSGDSLHHFLKSFRGNVLGAPSKAPWASLRRLLAPIPSIYTGGENMYNRARQDLTTPPLGCQVEWTLDLVDALKARERAGIGTRPLSLLKFGYPFEQPLEESVLKILLSGAKEVSWRVSGSS